MSVQWRESVVSADVFRFDTSFLPRWHLSRGVFYRDRLLAGKRCQEILRIDGNERRMIRRFLTKVI